MCQAHVTWGGKNNVFLKYCWTGSELKAVEELMRKRRGPKTTKTLQMQDQKALQSSAVSHRMCFTASEYVAYSWLHCCDSKPLNSPHLITFQRGGIWSSQFPQKLPCASRFSKLRLFEGFYRLTSHLHSQALRNPRSSRFTRREHASYILYCFTPFNAGRSALDVHFTIRGLLQQSDRVQSWLRNAERRTRRVSTALLLTQPKSGMYGEQVETLSLPRCSLSHA